MNTAPVLYAQFLQDIKQKTGRSADDWKALLQSEGLTRHRDCMQWLRNQHGLEYRSAYLLASHADETRPTYADQSGLVDAMYKTCNAALRPVHDSLTESIMMLGTGIKISVAKTMVTFRRKYVFAQIKPATKTRIDLGLALPFINEPPARLLSTGGLEKGDRISYRIAVTSEADIDRELEAWLQRAFEATVPGPA